MKYRFPGPTLEFHISRRARDLHSFEQSLFSLSGNVILANFHAARLFAAKLNARRDLVRFPERAVKAGQINAMGLIDEILHYVVRVFEKQKNSRVTSEAIRWLERKIGRDELDRALLRFVDEFPPLAVYRGQAEPAGWLGGRSGNVSHRRLALEELMMLWLANSNPAFSPYQELFDDAGLEKTTGYRRIVAALDEFFASQPAFGPDSQSLLRMLRSPAIAHPHSLTDQLEYIRRRWGHLIGDYLFRLLGSLDLIREEQKMAFLGAGPARVYDFRGLELEIEAFSPDQDWMPRVVMIAKNAYVWLDQLSKRYGANLHRLDQVPDEELDRLAARGFTGLWLIGLWERSRASKRIKQMCGNPEAEASAYSLLSYDIATDLGGWEAFNNLRSRAWQRGIRMAGDMVPNHMGIDSRWVVEHPHWFVSLPYSPFPSYSFNGPDLSWEQGVGIYLEDHYYERSDAAVVFKRRNHHSGEERYVYHGNDGTSMPWNDTAQLDFLNPEVREAVIRTILHVAHSFPIIRFDAAMTLTKKHYQRLWFPEPGSGGDIPSRADHGLSRERFDELMPKEFWREVVDRVAEEAPDTLLLAEAFWLLEGYFVRTLGMHRVYNSAFMNMLKNEDNAGYRQVIKNTLEFNPEILKRFVNFMNNPDEDTAVAQFGKGDKYFGVCTLMITLPGLPMFGHGQLEGLSEKYGMEYRRAYWDERPDEELVRRHEREIFPLLHSRTLFAHVEHFHLYDFLNPDGSVNEDVFAYSNRSGERRALVIYHNRYAATRGWIRTSTTVSQAGGPGGQRSLVRRSLGEGLGLGNDGNAFCIFRDHVSGSEYLRSCRELHERGLYAELQAYKIHVFIDFREVRDDPQHPYSHLADYLNGRGVPSIEEALRETVLQPVHVPFKELVSAGSYRRLMEAASVRQRDEEPGESGRAKTPGPRPVGAAGRLKALPPHPAGLLSRQLRQEFGARIDRLCQTVKSFSGGQGDAGALSAELLRKLAACLDLSALGRGLPAAPLQPPEYAWGTLLGWLFVHALGKITGGAEWAQQSRSWIDEWLLGKLLAAALQELGLTEGQAWRSLALVKILTTHQRWFVAEAGSLPSAYQALLSLLGDREVQEYLQVNRHGGILWFRDESFEELTAGLLLVAAVEALAEPGPQPAQTARIFAGRVEVLDRLRAAKERSGYQVETLLDLAKRGGKRAEKAPQPGAAAVRKRRK
jgi:glycosidase